MAKDESDSRANNSRIKKAFQLGIHAPFWAIVLLAAAVLGKRGDLTPTASEHWAMIVGFAEIGFGLIAAGFGACANYLDDSEEGQDLRRERRALRPCRNLRRGRGRSRCSSAHGARPPSRSPEAMRALRGKAAHVVQALPKRRA